MTDPLERRLRAALAIDPEPPDEPRSRTAAQRAIKRQHRRFRITGSALAVLVLAGGAVWIARSNDDRTSVKTGPAATTPTSEPMPPQPSVPPTVGVPTAALAAFRWSSLATAPIAPRAAFASVWTGSELLVWGGEAVTGSGALADGAAFNPATGTWRPLAPGPLSAQVGPFAVWTGTEMLIFGNGQASYDPEADRWTQIRPPPTSPARLLAVAWTGNDAVLFRDDGSVAAYAPARLEWRTLPKIPIGDATIWAINPVQAGDALLAWASTVSPSAGTDLDLIALDPSAEGWTKRTHPGRPQGIQDPPIWTGESVFIAAANAFRGGASGGGPSIGVPGVLYHPKSDSYTPVAVGPLDTLAAGAVWTGQAIIQTSFGQLQGFGTTDRNVQAGDTAAWDSATNSWTRLPTALNGIDFNGRTFWTGTSLLAYGPKGTLRLGP